MRLTNKTMNNNLLRNLQSGLQRMDRYNQQLATGKSIQLPSDNPVTASTIMRLKGSIKETEQYLHNVDSSISWLEATDSVLGEVTDVFHRAKELAVYGASDTMEPSSREALAREVEQLFDNVVQLANSTHGGKYLFAGQKTNTKPYEVTTQSGELLQPPVFHGDHEDLTVEIGAGSRLAINTKSHDTFDSILTALADMQKNLLANDSQALGNENLTDIENALDTLLTTRSQLGARTNRLELANERLVDLELNLNRLLSNAADVDVAESIMHLKAEENVYRTALSVGARIIQPTLVDFLR